jgi:hypothetical protein
LLRTAPGYQPRQGPEQLPPPADATRQAALNRPLSSSGEPSARPTAAEPIPSGYLAGALGLGVAAVLLTVAVWLIRTTDWSAPGGDPFDEDR